MDRHDSPIRRQDGRESAPKPTSNSEPGAEDTISADDTERGPR